MLYSFTCKYVECPNCHTNLTNDEGPPSILVNIQNNKKFTTTIGEEGNFLHTYLLDSLADESVVVTDTDQVTAHCLTCNTQIPIEPHCETN